MLEKLSKFFLYASVFSVVVVMPSTFFPFIGGKYVFFRICVSLALAFFLLYWAFEDKNNSARKRLKEVYRHPLFIAVSLFVLFYLLASLFAHSPSSAFWSNYERGEGGFQMIHYYIFFLLLLLVFREKKDWINLLKSSVIAAILVILYGVIADQRWVSNFISAHAQGTPPEGFWNRLTAGRFQGSLGNPAYIAPYLMFSIFYASYLFLNIKEKIIRYFLIASAILFICFFYLSRTRGGLVGFGISILIILIWLLFKTSGKTKKITSYVLLLVFAGGVFVSWVSFSVVPSCAEGICSSLEKSLASNRLLNFNFGEQTLKTRSWTWGSAWEGFKERPILGWGQENFSTVFDRHFNTNHYTPGANSETWFDRAHSVIFDYLAETGFLGFLSYLSIFIIFYWQILRKKTKDLNLALAPESGDLVNQKTNTHHFSTALILSVPAGYFVQGLALFDVLPIYINLFLVMSFTTYLLIENKTR